MKFFKCISLYFVLLFAFLGCGDSDPCSSVICKNAGDCVNGVCDCPIPYTGVDCTELLEPENVLIKNFLLSKVPATNNGACWDNLFCGNPDVYLQISNSSEVLFTSNVFENFDGESVTNGTVDLLLEWEGIYSFDLFDKDGTQIGNDDFILDIPFIGTISLNDRPDNLTIDEKDVLLFFEVEYKYN